MRRNLHFNITTSHIEEMMKIIRLLFVLLLSIHTLASAAPASPIVERESVAREGGNMQWAYHGQALYFFTGDRSTHDMNGDGMGGVWHAAPTAAPTTLVPASKAPAAGDSY
jgi:hypothetical protein